MSKKIRPENDIERLNNQQIILLTFLVAIISAITASVVVVRFYERNPNIITRVINNKEIVQQTIEKKPEIKVDKTIIIKESDLVVNAISKNSKFIFDLVLKKDGEEKVVGKAFKKRGKIFIKKIDIEETDKLFIKSIELKVVSEKDGVMILEEKGEGRIQEIDSAVGNMKIGSTVIGIFSKDHIEKISITKKINDSQFLLYFNETPNNIRDIALGVGISGKVFGVILGKNIYSFDYLLKKEK